MAKGRPTKCTEELIDEFCAELEQGMSLRGASGACNIGYATVKNWQNRGATGEEPYSTFLARSNRARDKGCSVVERHLFKHLFSDDPRTMGPGVSAAIKTLKCQYPDTHQDNIRLSGDRNNPVQTETSTRRDYSKLTDEELEQLEALHAKAERE